MVRPDRAWLDEAVESRETVPHETWAPIDGFPGYRVSDQGRVQSPSGRFIGKPNHVRGYVRVNLPVQQIRCVHQLVAEAFIGPSHGARVRHRDGDPTNNRVDNLRYGLPA